MVVADEGLAGCDVGTYELLISGWAIDPAGDPTPLFRSARNVLPPGPSGVVWSLDEGFGLWRVDATQWLE